MAKVSPEPNSGCWLWTGTTDGGRGYGKMSFLGRAEGAHRVSYILHCGPIATGLEIDHQCCVPACVNPAHLRQMTRAENLAISDKRGLKLGGLANGARNRAKTHCPQGHSYADAIITKQGWRTCRPCFYAKTRRQEARRKVRMAAPIQA